MSAVAILQAQLDRLYDELNEAQALENARYADMLEHGKKGGRRRAWRTAVKQRKRIERLIKRTIAKIPPTQRAEMGIPEPGASIVSDLTGLVSDIGGGGGMSGYAPPPPSSPPPEDEDQMLYIALGGAALVALFVAMRGR